MCGGRQGIVVLLQGPGQYRWLYLGPGPGPLCSTAAAAAPAAGNICLS